MICRLGNAQDIDAILDLLAEMADNGRIGPHFHWTRELLQEELWQYHFVIASVDETRIVEAKKIESDIGASENMESSVKYKSERVSAFIAYRHLGDQLIEISALATGQDFLRQDIMSHLVHFLIEVEKPVEVWLEVHEANQSAIKLYHRLGFELQGRRPRYYSDNAAALNYVWKMKK